MRASKKLVIFSFVSLLMISVAGDQILMPAGYEKRFDISVGGSGVNSATKISFTADDDKFWSFDSSIIFWTYDREDDQLEYAIVAFGTRLNCTPGDPIRVDLHVHKSRPPNNKA